ncbi:MAG: M17 family metallopeptidase, partial [Sulfobacillus sp.]
MKITWQRIQPEGEPDGWISSNSGWLDQNTSVLAHPSSKYFPMTGSDGLPWILCPSEGALRMINRQWAEATAFLIDRNVLHLGISLGTMAADKIRAALTGVVAGAYHYTKKDRVSLTIQSAPEIDPVIVDDVMALALAQDWVRYLVDTPSNEKPPQTLRDIYQKDAKNTIHWQVIEASELRAMGAGGILSVGQGSHRPPVLVAGKYEGNPGAPFLALVGKGVTFDSGGISLKPVESMGKMKADMAGSAAVMATLRLVAQQKWSVNVLAISGLAENLPGGGAYRPGDIITMLDGTRAEIITTDAEGRLLLGDGVAYAVQHGASAIVDIATLTGANMVALGGVR